jgi:hypothetical protein
MMRVWKVKTASTLAIVSFVAWGCFFASSGPPRPADQTNPQYEKEKPAPPKRAPARGAWRKYSCLEHPGEADHRWAEDNDSLCLPDEPAGS